MDKKQPDPYAGFEQGPIRPPSEAYSLFIRVTRNCPWNRCIFCPVYKGSRFSVRPVEHVKRDIDTVYRHVEMLQRFSDTSGHLDREAVGNIIHDLGSEELPALQAAYNWVVAGRMKSVFLQDANSPVIKPADLIEILQHLKRRFPMVERITSYARAQTIARRKDEDLKAICEAGLNRLHIGLESGSDRVLEMVKKGVTKQMHIQAGLKVRHAGMELSEYVMPGLGGKTLSEEHARQTADALNRINPDFIRLRTLAIPPGSPLFDDHASGRFDRCSELEVVQEILLFIEGLEGITSAVRSDHILNLFEDLEGDLPDGTDRILNILRVFLALDPERQRVYQVGRRLGIFRGLGDLDHPQRLARAERHCRELGITEENVDEISHDMMKRYI
jgi:radical SAM superfamily enzyme YgiQ (UPF0313 family)